MTGHARVTGFEVQVAFGGSHLMQWRSRSNGVARLWLSILVLAVLGTGTAARAQQDAGPTSQGDTLGRGAAIGDGRVLSDIEFGRDVGEPVDDPGVVRRLREQGAGREMSTRFDRPETGESNGERWRYRWYNDRWWYWTPENNWIIWTGDRWVSYEDLFPVQTMDIVQSHPGTYSAYYRRGFNSPYWGGFFYPYGDYPGAYPQTYGPDLSPRRTFAGLPGEVSPGRRTAGYGRRGDLPPRRIPMFYPGQSACEPVPRTFR